LTTAVVRSKFRLTAAALAGAAVAGAAALAVGSAGPAAAGPPAKKVITSADAPAAIGPYSQGIAAGNQVFVSGQLPIDPAVGKVDHGDDVAVQTAHSIENIEAVLAAAGVGLDNVVSTTVYLADMATFAEFNAVYEQYFGAQAAPARATVEVAALPQGAKVEISAIAVK
jgi:2-iminobutanoate/2-iminopropanoate deaminase